MVVRRVDNQYCPKVDKPCIEDDCAAWKETRVMPEWEYHAYLRSDIPVDRIIKGCRWCSFYKKDIPIVLRSGDDNQH